MHIDDLIEFLEDAKEQGITEIEIHQQLSWPLKGELYNARILDGKIALASGTASSYGSKRAWDDPDLDEPEEEGREGH